MDSLQIYSKIDSLNIRVLELEHIKTQFDSLIENQNIATIQMKLNESADIINNVQGFYESAWLKLIIVITLLGIIIPILVQFFQKNTLKTVTEYLSKEIKDNFNEKLEKLTNDNNNQFKSLSDRNDRETEKTKLIIEKLSHELEANLLYLQGRGNKTDKLYSSALHDFFRAAIKFLNCSKYDRADIMLTNIYLMIEMIEYKDKYDKTLVDFKIDISQFIIDLETSDNALVFRNNLGKIRNSISRLK